MFLKGEFGDSLALHYFCMKFLMLKLEVSPMWLLNMTHPELSVSLKSCIVAEQSVIKCSKIIEKWKIKWLTFIKRRGLDGILFS